MIPSDCLIRDLRKAGSGLTAACRVLLAVACLGFGFAAGEPETAVAGNPEKPEAASGEEAPLTIEEGGRQMFSLPGLKIDLKNKWVDLDAKLCLEAGLLELVACRPDTKEHESIVAVEAKAAHIHAGLLLLGAEPGNPAMRRAVDEERTRWVDLPPRGCEVEVFLVYKDAGGKLKVRPIQEFMVKAQGYDADPEEAEEVEKFPTSTFLFAGSHLYREGEGPARYLADESGNVISISTFGDELLCLPGVHSQMSGELVWEIDTTQLPPAGTPVSLRLKPRLEEAGKKPVPENPVAPPAEGE